jgi:hypothetical protein
MSTVGNVTSAVNPVGAVRTAVQIAVPTTPIQGNSSDIMLEAAVQRVATILYMRSRFEVPPDVMDMGGGLFNVVV